MIDYQKLISNLFNRSTQTINKLNINKQYIVGVFLFLYMRKGVLFLKNKENKLSSLLFILPYIGKTIKSKLYDETLKLERSINLNSKYLNVFFFYNMLHIFDLYYPLLKNGSIGIAPTKLDSSSLGADFIPIISTKGTRKIISNKLYAFKEI